MAEDDIYKSKGKYERYVQELDTFKLKPEERKGKGKYYCKNPKNIIYFKPLIVRFERNDLSYVRRLRLLNNFKLLLHSTEKLLADIDKKDDRTEIDNVIIEARKHISQRTIRDFLVDLKYMWKILFPALDEKNRPDETRLPYVVRHLQNIKIDKSREIAHPDRLDVSEYLKIIQALSDDKRIQLFCSLIYESLGRPQELAYTRICDVKVKENYATIQISSHGKEGIGLLRCIDSYRYLTEWLRQHPDRDNKNAYLFPTLYGKSKNTPLTMANVNKKLRETCKQIKLSKPITCYSFKRNGVSDLRLRGTPDKEIQSRARWTSTKQLHTYDITSQEQALRAELVRRGIVKANKNEKDLEPTTKNCPFCQAINDINDKTCYKCTRLLYAEDIEAEQKAKDSEIENIKKQMAEQNALLMKLLKAQENERTLDKIKKK